MAYAMDIGPWWFVSGWLVGGGTDGPVMLAALEKLVVILGSSTSWRKRSLSMLSRMFLSVNNVLFT